MKLEEGLSENLKLVMITDNAPCHSSIEEIFQENEFDIHRLLRLGPYSPMLNAIEYTWC